MIRDSRPPTQSEAAALGLTVEEATVHCNVWPDNVLAINTFISMLTQWRAGAMGVLGLDYTALPVVLECSRVPRDEWPQVFDDVRVMEDEALRILRAKNG